MTDLQSGIPNDGSPVRGYPMTDLQSGDTQSRISVWEYPSAARISSRPKLHISQRVDHDKESWEGVCVCVCVGGGGGGGERGEDRGQD